jgi:O-Antigen ligase
MLSYIDLGFCRISTYLAGLTVSWRDCKLVMRTIAVAAAAFVGVAWVLRHVDTSGRSSLEFGSLQNSNDLAAVLILLLPFLLWFVFSSRSLVLRVAACGIMAMGFYEILHTGSRGSLVGLVVASLFYLWRGTGRQRMCFLCLVPIAAAALLAVVPKSALNRITQFSQAATIDDTIALAAAQSTQSRMRLLRTSIEYTLHFPLFGVGPGQFLNYEGQHDILPGLNRGMWHVTHNAYTQVSSECGIPAFLFFMAAIVASFRLLSRVYRQARARPDGGDIRTMAFCLMLSMTGFCTAIVFLSLAYSLYLPVLSGLAVAIARAAPEEFRERSAKAAASPALVGTFAGWPAARRQPPGI